MAHPQAVALAEPCPHEICHQWRVASRPPSACVCVRAGVYARSVLGTAGLPPHKGAVRGLT